MRFASLCLVLLSLLTTALAAAQNETTGFADLAARASAARRTNDTKAAIDLYRQALQLRPEWEEGWWMAGSLQYDTGEYREGAESLRRLVAFMPNAGPGWALLGLCEYETGEYAGALEHIRRSLSLGVGDQPQMVLVLKFHEAALLTKMGQFDAAMQKYAAFVPSQVTDQQVLLGLGLTALRRAATPAEVAPPDKDLCLMAGRALAAFLTHDPAGAARMGRDSGLC